MSLRSPKQKESAAISLAKEWLCDNRPYLEDYLDSAEATAEEREDMFYVLIEVPGPDGCEEFTFWVDLDPEDVTYISG